MTTPRPWPENAIPTPEQLAGWLAECTPEERVALCARMLDSADRAHRCFLMNHDSLQDEVLGLRARIQTARQEGWNDALAEVAARLEAS